MQSIKIDVVIMTKTKTILDSIALAVIILLLSGVAYLLGASVYLVFALYLFVIAYGFYKKYWDLILGVLWIFVAYIVFGYWAAYWISQIN